jgi:hypothetical protein
MDDTDPFGREKDDDPLAEMGWASGGTVKPPEGPADLGTPVPDAAPSTPMTSGSPLGTGIPGQAGPTAPRQTDFRSQYRPAPSGVSGQRRRRRGPRMAGIGCGAFFVIALAVIGVIAAIVIPAVVDVVDTVEDSIPTIPDTPRDPGGRERGDTKDARPPSGLERTSLLRRGNLSPALQKLKRVTKSSRVRLLRVDAQRVVVQTAAANGGTKLAQATWDGNVQLLSTSPGGGGTTFPWSRVDPSAPNRIVRATTRGRKASSFDYAVLIDAAGLRWSAFLKTGGGTFQAEPDGSGVHKIG